MSEPCRAIRKRPMGALPCPAPVPAEYPVYKFAVPLPPGEAGSVRDGLLFRPAIRPYRVSKRGREHGISYKCKIFPVRTPGNIRHIARSAATASTRISRIIQPAVYGVTAPIRRIGAVPFITIHNRRCPARRWSRCHRTKPHLIILAKIRRHCLKPDCGWPP